MKGIALALAIGTLTACRADGATAPGQGSAQPEAVSPMVVPSVVQTTPAPKPEPALEQEQELEPEPEPELVPSPRWPFYVWDNARAYVYNLQPYGPGGSLLVYSQDKGWNAAIHHEQAIDTALANKAVTLVGKTQGEMLVSKCPFPRHAIVLLSGKTPVASINVCFSCGDILIWPPYAQSADWPAQKSAMQGKLMKIYDRVFAEWTALFADDIGLQTDWEKVQ